MVFLTSIHHTSQKWIYENPTDHWINTLKITNLESLEFHSDWCVCCPLSKRRTRNTEIVPS